MAPTCGAATAPPSWLSCEYLQVALRLARDDPTLGVRRYHVSPATRKGVNYLSDLFRVTVQVVSSLTEELQCRDHSLILKCHPRGGYREDFVKTAKFFTRELCMLRNTLPEMYCLLKKSESEIRYKKLSPNYIHHGEDSDDLIMEDLSESGFRLANRSGLDLPHCMLVMNSLAIFHAVSVALNELKPECLDPYRQNVFCDETRGYMGSYLMSTIRSLATEVEKWPDYSERYVEKLKALADCSWQKITDSTTRVDDSFNVLNHGDLWINNIMFRYSETGEVEDLSFVDFQICHFASPAIDLHYFLYTSPTPDVRVHHYDSLLQEYHKSLGRALAILGCANKTPTMEQLQQDLQKRMFYAFFAASSALPNLLAQPDQGFDLELSLESGENPNSKNSKMFGGELYKQEIQRLLPIFEQGGIF